MIHQILIATDGSDFAKRAVERGVALAKVLGASVTFITVTADLHLLPIDPGVVLDTPAIYEQHMQRFAERTLTEAAEVAKAAGVAAQTVRVHHQHPWQAIINTATERGADMIVMATHGRTGPIARMIGSETQKVLTHTKVPVLVVR